ncbi:hypothetical protein GCM10028895_12100 [Pontibacter rugosus]
MKDNFLQDTWQIHTEVQEQMLRLRSTPVSVKPESARIIGEKLYLNADENDKTEKVLEDIASIFQMPSAEINVEKGYLLADIAIAQNIDKERKIKLSERAAANFIKFQPLPVIDGYINKKSSPVGNLQKLLETTGLNYTFDKKGRLQISISDLRKLDTRYIIDEIDIKIPEVASVILGIRPSPLFFLKKNFLK